MTKSIINQHPYHTFFFDKIISKAIKNKSEQREKKTRENENTRKTYLKKYHNYFLFRFMALL